MQVKIFIYLFHSNIPWFHSFIKKITIIIINTIIDNLKVIDFMLINTIGMITLISKSNIKNIMVIKKKFIENEFFILDKFKKPHSKVFDLSL